MFFRLMMDIAAVNTITAMATMATGQKIIEDASKVGLMHSLDTTARIMENSERFVQNTARELTHRRERW